MNEMDVWLLGLIGVCAFFSIVYCIMYWCKLIFENKEPRVIATFDAQLPGDDQVVPCEPGFEFEMPPPTYEEAIRVNEENLATYGLRHRNSEDVRREEIRMHGFGGNQSGDGGQNGDRNGDRSGDRNGDRSGDRNGDRNGGRNGDRIWTRL